MADGLLASEAEQTSYHQGHQQAGAVAAEGAVHQHPVPVLDETRDELGEPRGEAGVGKLLAVDERALEVGDPVDLVRGRERVRARRA